MSGELECSLQRAVFENRLKEDTKLDLSDEQIKDMIDMQDIHGNTALNLAAILGRTDAIKWLLAHGAKVRINNKLKSNAFDESVSYGKRENIELLYKKRFEQELEVNKSKEDRLKSVLHSIPDVRLKVTWEFKTKIPFLSSLLPSDVCTIQKKGFRIRMDTSIPCFDSISAYALRTRNDVSILFGEISDSESIDSILLDHKKHTFFRMDINEESRLKNTDLSFFMSNELYAVRLDLDKTEIRDVHTGFFTKYPKVINIGDHLCRCKVIENIQLVTTIRSEHLTSEILEASEKRRAQIEEKVKDESNEMNLTELLTFEHVPDLPPHKETGATFEDYLKSDDYYEVIGREVKISTMRRRFELEFATTDDRSDLSVNDLIRIIECFVTLKHFKRLKYFLELIGKDGFPLRIEVPLFATIRAIVNFDAIELFPEIDDSIFCTPEDYYEVQDPR